MMIQHHRDIIVDTLLNAIYTADQSIKLQTAHSHIMSSPAPLSPLFCCRYVALEVKCRT